MDRFSGLIKKLSIPDVLTDEHETNLFERLTAYPELWELAGLSSHVTHQKFQMGEGDWVNWIIIAEAIDTESKYHGTAYHNTTTRHLVIAHSATKDFKSKRDNLLAIYSKKLPKTLSTMSERVSSAYLFTRYVLSTFAGTFLSVTNTGHSLGGWLAQNCALYLKYPEYAKKRNFRENPVYIQNEKIYHQPSNKPLFKSSFTGLKITTIDTSLNQSVGPEDSVLIHTVAFDSPGFWPELVSIVDSISIDRMYSTTPGDIYSRRVNDIVGSLDIRVFILDPNPVNACYKHVGDVLFVQDNREPHEIFPDEEALKREGTYWHSIVRIQNILRLRGHECINRILKSPFKPTRFTCKFLVGGKVKDSYVEKEEGLIAKSSEFVFCKWDRRQMRMSRFNEAEIEVVEALRNFYDKNNPVDLKLDLPFFGGEKVRSLFQTLRIIGEGSICDFKGTMWTSEQFLTCIKCLTLKRKDIAYVLNIENALVHCQIASQRYLKDLIQLCPKKPVKDSLESFANELSNFLGDGCERLILLIESVGCGRRAAMSLTLLTLTELERQGKITLGRKSRFGKDSEAWDSFQVSNLNSFQEFQSHFPIRTLMDSTRLNFILLEVDLEDIEKIRLLIDATIKIPNTRKLKFIFVCSEFGKECINALSSDIFTLYSLDAIKLEFEDLNESSQSRILSSNIQIQNTSFTLMQIPDVAKLMDFDTLSRIFVGEQNLIPVCLGIEKPPFYINRLVKQLVLTNPSQIKEKSPNDFFVIDCDDAHLEVMAWVTRFMVPGTFECFSPVPDQDHFSKISERHLGENIHLFHFNESAQELCYVKSAGLPCWEVLDESSDLKFIEGELVSLTSRFIIVADEPGNGKSTYMKMLFHEILNRQLGTCNGGLVIFLELASLQSSLCKKGGYVEFISDAIGIKDKWMEKVIDYFLQQESTYVLLDSFDELDDGKRKIVVRHLECLTKCKVRIATRKWAGHFLQPHFSAVGYSFCRFTDEEQLVFLVQFFMSKMSQAAPIEEGKLREFSRIVRGQVVNLDSLSNKDADFLGIPLLLSMLGTINLPNLEKLEKDEDVPKMEPITLGTELYEQFVNAMYNLRLKNISGNQHDLLRKYYTKLHCKATAQFLKFDPLKFDLNLDPADVVALMDLGIFQTNTSILASITQQNEVSFYPMHQTLAEYFLGIFLFQNLESKREREPTIQFLRENYFKESFDTSRHFLDELLLKNSSIPPEDKKHLGMKYVRNVAWNQRDYVAEEVDLLGRNVLHYFVGYGNHEKGILPHLIYNIKHLHSVDDMGEGCLSHSVFHCELFEGCVFKYRNFLAEQQEQRLFGKTSGIFSHPFLKVFLGVTDNILHYEHEIGKYNTNSYKESAETTRKSYVKFYRTSFLQRFSADFPFQSVIQLIVQGNCRNDSDQCIEDFQKVSQVGVVGTRIAAVIFKCLDDNRKRRVLDIIQRDPKLYNHCEIIIQVYSDCGFNLDNSKSNLVNLICETPEYLWHLVNEYRLKILGFIYEQVLELGNLKSIKLIENALLRLFEIVACLRDKWRSEGLRRHLFSKHPTLELHMIKYTRIFELDMPQQLAAFHPSDTWTCTCPVPNCGDSDDPFAGTLDFFRLGKFRHDT